MHGTERTDGQRCDKVGERGERMAAAVREEGGERRQAEEPAVAASARRRKHVPLVVCISFPCFLSVFPVSPFPPFLNTTAVAPRSRGGQADSPIGLEPVQQYGSRSGEWRGRRSQQMDPTGVSVLNIYYITSYSPLSSRIRSWLSWNCYASSCTRRRVQRIG